MPTILTHVFGNTKLVKDWALNHYYDEKEYTDTRSASKILHPKEMLTILYANGLGVDRNIDLAIHFACNFSIITEDRIRLIEHLSQLKAGKTYKKEFDVLYYNDNYYLEIEDKIQKLERKINEFINPLHWGKKQLLTSKEQRLLHILKRHVDNYIWKRIYFEIDNYTETKNLYTEALHNYEDWAEFSIGAVYCLVPEYNKEAYIKVHADLKRLFSILQNNELFKKPIFARRGTFQDLLETEQVWIKYKKAMETFGRTRCPQVDPYTWATILTGQRVKQLQERVNTLK